MELAPLDIFNRSIKGLTSTEKLFSHPYLAHFLFKHIIGPRIIDNEPSWAKNTRVSFLKLGADKLPREVIPSLQKVLKLSLQSNKNILDAHDNNKDLIWFTWPVPIVILKTFGVATFCPEIFYSMASAIGAGGGGVFCDIAEQNGVPSEICSINRSMLGGLISNQLPRPTIVVTANHPCDGNHTGNLILDSLVDCPSFIVGGAYKRTPEAIGVWSQSFFNLISFLEEKLQKPFDWDLLKHKALNINRCNNALNKVTLLHRALPCPALANILTVFWRCVCSESGQDETVEAAELLLAAAEEILEKQKRNKTPREKIRVAIGDQGMAWHDLGAWMSRHFNATIVSDYLGGFRHPEIDVSSKESMIAGIAHERLHFSMIRQAHGTMEYTLNELAQVLQDFSIDAIIFNNHMGCKHNLALKREIEDLCKAARVPACFIGADIIDNRQMSEHEIKAKVRQFFLSQEFKK